MSLEEAGEFFLSGLPPKSMMNFRPFKDIKAEAGMCNAGKGMSNGSLNAPKGSVVICIGCN